MIAEKGTINGNKGGLESSISNCEIIRKSLITLASRLDVFYGIDFDSLYVNVKKISKEICNYEKKDYINLDDKDYKKIVGEKFKDLIKQEVFIVEKDKILLKRKRILPYKIGIEYMDYIDNMNYIRCLREEKKKKENLFKKAV